MDNELNSMVATLYNVDQLLKISRFVGVRGGGEGETTTKMSPITTPRLKCLLKQSIMKRIQTSGTDCQGVQRVQFLSLISKWTSFPDSILKVHNM